MLDQIPKNAPRKRPRRFHDLQKVFGGKERKQDGQGYVFEGRRLLQYMSDIEKTMPDMAGYRCPYG